MNARRILLLVMMLCATAASAGALPLRPGTYVLAGVPCHDPAFAAVFVYDGHQFAYPHASHCRSAVLSHSGKTFDVEETCSALGDGSRTQATTSSSTYTIQSAGHVLVRQKRSDAGQEFRWCPTPISKAFR